MINTYDPVALVNLATGELLKQGFENDKWEHKKAREAKSEEALKYKRMREESEESEKIMREECGTFYFNFFQNGLYEIPIKESIKTRFLYLYTYAQYGNKGAYLETDNHRLMTKDDIKKVLKLSDREFRETLKTLLETGLLMQDGTFYLTNTYLAIRGEVKGGQKNKPYTRMFDKGVRSLYEECKTTQHKQLYYLFRLLPYVNLKFNAICQNPNEEYAEHVIPLKLKEICEIVGYNQTNTNRFKKELYKLKVFDQYAIKGIDGENGMWFKINPRIMYAGTDGHLNEFLELLGSDFSISVK